MVIVTGNGSKKVKVIKREKGAESFGNTLAISGDGLTVIVGSYTSPEVERYAGKVEVFRFIKNEWIEIGDILGDKVDDEFGWDVDINYDGNIIAVSARENQNGFVRLFKYDNYEWTQMGEDLVAKEEKEYFGRHIALNSAGNTVVISAIHSEAKQVTVYEYINNHWVEKGNGFNGFNGHKISVDGNGDIVALNDGGTIGVYKFNGSEWVLIGEKLSNMGLSSMSLSNDGFTLAIGMKSDKIFGRDGGRTKVYKYDGTDWVQLGDTFYNHSGNQTTINGEGNIIATGGSAYFDEEDKSFFNPKVYGLIDGKWKSLNLSIDSEKKNKFIGLKFSLSDDGFTLAIGGHSKTSNFGYTEDLRVYTHSTRTYVKNQDNKQNIKLYPNPANEKVNIEINESDQLIECTIIDLNGRTVFSKTSKELDFLIDLNKLPSGVYYVTVKYYNGISREKLIIQ